MAKHKKAEPQQEPRPAQVEKSKEVEMNFTEKTRSGEFALATCGDLAVLTDLTGKRLSKPMTIEEAQNVFQRMANSRR